MAASPDEVPSREEPYAVVLEGIVGSTAYGLNTPTSDIDHLGVFVEPTETFLSLAGLPQRKQSWKAPGELDRTLHELGKYCSKVLHGNPTFTELLWLPKDLYVVCEPIGEELIELRSLFLSAKPTRDAYLGYATQQFRKLEQRGDGSFSSDTRKRTAKHARHMLRLLKQGYHAWATGEIRVRLDDPDYVREFGERVAAGDIELADATLVAYEMKFDMTETVLPDRPDREAIDEWLRETRKRLL
jgi:hypothetical protein